MNYPRAIWRHYQGRFDRLMALVGEFAVGWGLSLKLIPRLIRMSPILLAHRARRTGYSQASDGAFTNLPKYYINLDRRVDRKKMVEREFKKVGGVTPVRFRAIEDDNGSLGCAKSHLQLLRKILKSGEDAVLIFEDDIELVGTPESLNSATEEFLRHPALDVLCISFRLRGPKFRITKELGIANNIQTTAGYIVKRRAIPSLIRVFAESVELLEGGVSPEIASIDIQWKRLQMGQNFFAVPLVPLGRQRKSYSDIAKRVKFYG